MVLTREDALKLVATRKLLFWNSVILLVGPMLVNLIDKLFLHNNPGSFEAVVLLGSWVILTGLLWCFQVWLVIRFCRLLDVGNDIIIYVVLQCFPIVFFVILLFLYQRATKKLRDSGIRVGWFGAYQEDLDQYFPVQRQCPECGEPLDGAVAKCPMCGAARS